MQKVNQRGKVHRHLHLVRFIAAWNEFVEGIIDEMAKRNGSLEKVHKIANRFAVGVVKHFLRSADMIQRERVRSFQPSKFRAHEFDFFDFHFTIAGSEK